MSDKWEKVSIYDVDFKIEDSDGVEQVFTFKPLPFATYPKVYDLLSKFSDIDSTDGKAFINSLDEKTMNNLLEVELQMVMNSYPDMNREKAERFVLSNVFDLIDPLVGITFRQEKVNARKMQSIKE